MDTYSWYATLVKPAWAPPAWVFGPVWTFLYAIITISFGFVFYRAFTGMLPWMIALPFALNLVFNVIFTPIQFGLQNNVLAVARHCIGMGNARVGSVCDPPVPSVGHIC